MVQKEELRGKNISLFGSVCEVLEIFGAKRNFKVQIATFSCLICVHLLERFWRSFIRETLRLHLRTTPARRTISVGLCNRRVAFFGNLNQVSLRSRSDSEFRCVSVSYIFFP